MIVSETEIDFRPGRLPYAGNNGEQLAYSNWTQFGPVQGTPGIGLGFCSCNASIAIQTHPNYSSSHDGRFDVVHGNSQIFRGLDQDNPGPDQPSRMFASSPDEQHAEQMAVRVMQNQGGNGVQPWMVGNVCQVYIDIGPCPNCRQWLQSHALRFALYYVKKYEDAGKGMLERMHRANRRHFKNDVK